MDTPTPPDGYDDVAWEEYVWRVYEEAQRDLFEAMSYVKEPEWL